MITMMTIIVMIIRAGSGLGELVLLVEALVALQDPLAPLLEKVGLNSITINNRI